MTFVPHKTRHGFAGIAGAIALAAAVTGGLAYWYVNTDRPMEMARLDDGPTVSTAPVTEDTPAPAVNDIDHARNLGLHGDGRFAPLPDARQDSPPR
jgi:hypothetical protein